MAGAAVFVVRIVECLGDAGAGRILSIQALEDLQGPVGDVASARAEGGLGAVDIEGGGGLSGGLEVEGVLALELRRTLGTGLAFDMDETGVGRPLDVDPCPVGARLARGQVGVAVVLATGPVGQPPLAVVSAARDVFPLVVFDRTLLQLNAVVLAVGAHGLIVAVAGRVLPRAVGLTHVIGTVARIKEGRQRSSQGYHRHGEAQGECGDRQSFRIHFHAFVLRTPIPRLGSD